LTCARCSTAISAEDTVESHAGGLVHVDCRQPRQLSAFERALTLKYCWSHAVATCVACAQSFGHEELGSVLVGSAVHVCPRCGADLTDSVRAHLYTCAAPPSAVILRAREVRQAARKLVKRGMQLVERADVLTREAEAAISALRASTKRSDEEALRRFIQAQLREGSLPHERIPSTISGSPGDGSRCSACAQAIARGSVMMVVTIEASARSAPHETRLFRFHAACFQLWDGLRRTVKPAP
jgi:hypothetical protein